MFRLLFNKKKRDEILNKTVGEFGSTNRWYDRRPYPFKINIAIVLSLLAVIAVSIYLKDDNISNITVTLLLFFLCLSIVFYSRYIIDIHMFVTKKSIKGRDDTIFELNTELGLEKERSNILFKDAPHMHFLVDSKTGKIVDVNEHGGDEFGYNPPSAFIGVMKNSLVDISDMHVYESVWCDVVSSPMQYRDISYVAVTLFGNNINISERMILLNNGIVSIVGKNITDYKWLVSQSIEQQNNMNSIFEKSNAAILILNNDGIINCNKAMLDIFGCNDPKDVVGKTPWDFSPKYQPDGSLSEVKAVEMMDIAGKRGAHDFYWTHLSNGVREFPARVHLVKIKEDDRELLYATVIDISERVKREEMLIAEKNKVEAFIDESPNGLIVFNRYKIEYVNKSFENLFDIKKEDLNVDGSPIRLLVGRLPEVELVGILSLCMNEIMSYKNEFQYVNTRGMNVWVRLDGFNIHSDDNKYISTMLTFTNITDIMDLSLELQLTKHKLHHFFDIGNDGMYELDSEYKILSANDALVNMFGAKNAIGVFVYDSIDPIEINRVVLSNRSRIKQKDTSPSRRKVLMSPNKTDPFVAEITSSLRFDDSGVFSGTIGVIRKMSIDPKVYKENILRKRELKNNVVTILDKLNVSEDLAKISGTGGEKNTIHQGDGDVTEVK